MAERITVNSKKPASIKENQISHKRKTDFRSNSSPVNRILYLQRTIGNQAVQRMVKSGALQAKLRIGQPGDVYEQEADRVADAVMRMPEPGVQRQEEPEEEEEEILQAKPLAEEITPLVQRQVEPEEEEEETLQSKPLANQITPLVQVQRQEEKEEIRLKSLAGAAPEITPEIGRDILSIKGSGQPLSALERAFFEPRFGADFGDVHVHSDARAASLARSINARAFTLGHNVVFGAGEYSSDPKSGRKLIAHELTHVVQQGAAALKGKAPIIQRNAGKDLIQRAVTETKQDSYAGLFELAKHNPLGGPTFRTPAKYDVKLEFNPYQVVDCEDIALTQSSVALINGTPVFASPADRSRALTAAEGTEGLAIDRLSGKKSPYYGRNNSGTVAAGTQSGERTGTGGSEKRKKAFLSDKPGLAVRSAGKKLAMDFESCAICAKGVDQDVYYGCVSWGFDIDAVDKFTEHPFNLISKGTPSTNFLEAAKKWNAQTVPVATDDLPLPTHKTKQTSMTEAQLKAEIKTLKTTLKGLVAGHVNIPQITFEIKVYQDILGAMAYNKQQGYHIRDIKAIQTVVGSWPNGTYDFNTITKIKKWQVEQGLKGDGRFGSKSKKKFDDIVKAAVATNKAKGFTVDQIKKIQRKMGSNDDGVWGPITVKHLMVWQNNMIMIFFNFNPTGVFDMLTKILMFGTGGF